MGIRKVTARMVLPPREATPNQLNQLRYFVAERQAELRRREEEQAETQRAAEERSLRELRAAIAHELHGLGVAWMWEHGGELIPMGQWERVVDLCEIEFIVPEFRPFRLVMGKWVPGPKSLEQRGTMGQQWHPAEFQTGGEVPSWYGIDAQGEEIACLNFAHALDVSLIREGDPPATELIEVKP